MLARLITLVLLLAGCATAQLDTEWKSPAPAQSLKGGMVFVMCGAPDEALRRVCEDVWFKQLGERGVRATRAYEVAAFAPTATPADIEAAAKKAGASAVMSTRLGAGSTTVSRPGPNVGVGVGGGWGGGGFSIGGVGISFPIGGGASTTPSLAASSSLVEVASGQVVWSGTATDTGTQESAVKMSALTDVLLEALKRSGFL